MRRTFEDPRRRDFLRAIGGGALMLCAAPAGAASAKPLRGIFVIAQTPFTESDTVDMDTLVGELKFVDRGRVHGFVWPQLASEWSTLTEHERLEGAEAILAAGKKLRPAVVIGVQGPDTAAAVRYAKHAAKLGADALISLPPAGVSDSKALVEYYAEIGRATELPLFVQAIGNMTVESLVAMYKAIPTMRHIKYEARQPLQAIEELRRASSDELSIFTGNHGRTLIDEMWRGSAGSMPAASFGDLYAQVWDLWHENKHNEALEIWGKVSALVTEIGVYSGIDTLKYILYLRGVFKTYGIRRERNRASADAAKVAAGGGDGGLSDTGKQVLREMMGALKPWLKA
jgi:4-hydroxy-tetrahydrodipicolinate synthase